MTTIKVYFPASNRVGDADLVSVGRNRFGAKTLAAVAPTLGARGETLWMALTLIGVKTRYGNYEMTADCSMRVYDNHAAAASAAQALVA